MPSMNVKVTDRNYLKQQLSDVLMEFKTTSNITYQELADLLGTNYLQVNRWVKKQTLPIPETLKSICNTLGVDYHSFLGGSSSFLDKITIDSLVSHYTYQAQRSEEQKRVLGITAALLYDYLLERNLSPTLLIQAGGDSEFFSDPGTHNLQAVFTSPGIGNLSLYGTTSAMKFKFLDRDAVDLSEELFVNAVNRQLIKRELI